MSCPGSEDAIGSNLKGNPSDLDDRRRLDSLSDQREDNVTAPGTTDRCTGASSLPVPVKAAPYVLESLQEVIKQGPILREIQRGMTDLCSRVGDLEHKRGRSSSCDRNTSGRNIIRKKNGNYYKTKVKVTRILTSKYQTRKHTIFLTHNNLLLRKS